MINGVSSFKRKENEKNKKEKIKEKVKEVLSLYVLEIKKKKID